MHLRRRTVSHRQLAFEILKLSVLDKNLCGTEVVSTRLLRVYYTSFLNKKNDAKTGKIFFIKSWISRERNTLEKIQTAY